MEEYTQRLGEAFVSEMEWTTPEALAEAGYVVLAPGPEHQRRFLERLAPEHGGTRSVRPDALVDAAALEPWIDSAVDATELHSIGVAGEHRDMLWAFHYELIEPVRMLVWVPTPDGWRWATVRTDTWQERMLQLVRAMVSEGFGRALDELVRHLRLDELGLVRQDGAEPLFVAEGPFDAIVNRHAARGRDILHFASVGGFAVTTAERALPPGADRFAELGGFRREIARHAMCRLLESAEIAIGEHRDGVLALLDDRRSCEAYREVSRSFAGSGEERLRALVKALGGRLDGIDEFKLLNKLRHCWTHRSATADQRLFADLGRSGKQEAKLTWAGVVLEVRQGDEVIVDEQHVRATYDLLTGVIAGLMDMIREYVGRLGVPSHSGLPTS
jgi:hypothetical protein